MAPRNATTPLSPLSPDPDQAPGLSRTPSFLKFTPQVRAMASFDNPVALANYGERLREARKIVWREQGRATRRAAGPVGVSRARQQGRPRGGWLGVRYPLGCQSDPAHDQNRRPAEHAAFGPESFRLAAMLGRGAPTPPAHARSSATPFSTPRPLPRTLPSLTTPSRPRPAPLDGRADAPGVTVQANAAMMLRAGGRGCESLREARAADRDRAADVEGETVLTVSPSLCPLSPIRAPQYRPPSVSSSRPRLATGNRLKPSTFANGARRHALTNSSVARRLSACNASQRPCLLWQADDERRLVSTPGVTRPWVGCPASV